MNAKREMKKFIWNGLIAFVLLAIAWPCVGDGVQRERLADGWEFMRADGSASETNSAAWRAVRVPHDWGVEKSFDFLKLKEAGVNAIRCSHNPDASRPSCARMPMRRKQSPSRLHLLDSRASRLHCIGRWKTLIFTFHTLALDGAEKRA